MYKIVKHAFFAVALGCAAQTALAAGDAAAGKDKAATCAACHGADGNSMMPTFPKLAGLGEKYIYKQLKDVKSGARVIMEMTGILDPLSDQDMEDIAAYYAAQTMQLSGAKDLQLLTNAGVEVDGLELGAKVYRGGNKETGVPACMGCHSPTGQGNSPAGYPRLSGQYPEYIEKQLRAFRAGERTNDGDPMTMRSVAKGLSDAELKALANYIAGLN
ncbi:c-type cytochrome [Halioxenophilus aromaticivorans]|uniref:C-type cytochrome n=1 Tax=Halioxenophilus aromaticivorans TaxID=1306992 RepID=A0AAV3U815_9ALTE